MAVLTGYLLDTNVISETVRAAPDPSVMRWLDSLEPEQLYVSVLSLGEIRKGALAVADKRRRDKLLAWLHNKLPEWFENRVLPIDAAVCERWADLMVKAGTPTPAIDSLLAATAAHVGLVVATRNVRDFVRLEVGVFNPWEF
ncbi:type II toxin-antitoxin system VapC family toxin [Rhodoferax ferrireducens]|uniref:type II toxin-antitoxin system VapC family toxin n=1 Tax=Rhodoferax ferrireducens TaxID=192843 RepID=UPI00298EBB13|nr:type II toxin-antitoxin system VapC family toxin [Rhodoferax ferrireducens]WPC67492.1 type II toxin-antitoxin system VapC family toxin [Rhodoferax ferrireducens]